MALEAAEDFGQVFLKDQILPCFRGAGKFVILVAEDFLEARAEVLCVFDQVPIPCAGGGGIDNGTEDPVFFFQFLVGWFGGAGHECY